MTTANEFLRDYIGPRAQALDSDPEALRTALNEMSARGLMGLRIPVENGGLGVSNQEFRAIQETAARYSGCFAFLQTQHQSGCSHIVSSPNTDLQARYLPKLATGHHRVGIAFSQLRRPGPPMLIAEVSADGFSLTGVAPWATGAGMYDLCIVAAVLPSGESVWLLIDWTPAPGFSQSGVMQLAAFEPAQTVSLKFDKFHVDKNREVFRKPPNWIHDNDSITVILQAPFALGCAQAGIDVLQKEFEKKKIEEIATTGDKLQLRLDEIRVRVYEAMDADAPQQEKLEARAEAINICMKSAQSAVIAASGGGNSVAHPAQRVYREALVFAVSAQTTPIMEASLRLVSDSPSQL